MFNSHGRNWTCTSTFDWLGNEIRAKVVFSFDFTFFTHNIHVSIYIYWLTSVCKQNHKHFNSLVLNLHGITIHIYTVKMLLHHTQKHKNIVTRYAIHNDSNLLHIWSLWWHLPLIILQPQNKTYTICRLQVNISLFYRLNEKVEHKYTCI